MSVPVHFEAPSALDFFATLVAEDSSLPLLEAAVAVAQDDTPGLDVQGVLAQVDAMAERLCTRLPEDAAPLQRLRLLNRYFFHELGFAGNVNNYYDAGNSLLPTVLRTRRGIPLTLALLYIELATQAGLAAVGVSFPGHFLVKLSMPRGEVVVDPFTGRSLTREDLEERLQPYRRERPESDAEQLPLGLFLQPSPPREVLARLLRNLKHVHRQARDLHRLLAVQRRLVLVLPDDATERRELCQLLAQSGRHQEAAAELATYLRRAPDAPDADALRRELAQMRRAH